MSIKDPYISITDQLDSMDGMNVQVLSPQDYGELLNGIISAFSDDPESYMELKSIGDNDAVRGAYIGSEENDGEGNISFSFVDGDGNPSVFDINADAPDEKTFDQIVSEMERVFPEGTFFDIPDARIDVVYKNDIGQEKTAMLPDSVSDRIENSRNSGAAIDSHTRDIADSIRSGYVPMEYRAGYTGRMAPGEIKFSEEQINEFRDRDPGFGKTGGFDCARRDERERTESNRIDASEARPNRITFENTFAGIMKNDEGKTADELKRDFEAKYEIGTASIIEKSETDINQRGLDVRIDKIGRFEQPVRMWEVSVREKDADGRVSRNSAEARATFVGDIFGRVIKVIDNVPGNRLDVKENGGYIKAFDRAASDIDRFRIRSGFGKDAAITRFTDGEKSALEQKTDVRLGKYADILADRINDGRREIVADINRYSMAARIYGDAADRIGLARNVIQDSIGSSVNVIETKSGAVGADISFGGAELSADTRELIDALGSISSSYPLVGALEENYEALRDGAAAYGEAADRLSEGLDRLDRYLDGDLGSASGAEKLEYILGVEAECKSTFDPVTTDLDKAVEKAEAVCDVDKVISDRCDALHEENVEKYGEDDAKYYDLTYDRDTGKVYTYSGYTVPGEHINDMSVSQDRTEYSRSHDNNIDEDDSDRRGEDRADGSPIDISEERYGSRERLCAGGADVADKIGNGDRDVRDIIGKAGGPERAEVLGLYDKVSRDGTEFKDSITADDLKSEFEAGRGSGDEKQDVDSKEKPGNDTAREDVEVEPPVEREKAGSDTPVAMERTEPEREEKVPAGSAPENGREIEPVPHETRPAADIDRTVRPGQDGPDHFISVRAQLNAVDGRNVVMLEPKDYREALYNALLEIDTSQGSNVYFKSLDDDSPAASIYISGSEDDNSNIRIEYTNDKGQPEYIEIPPASSDGPNREFDPASFDAAAQKMAEMFPSGLFVQDLDNPIDVVYREDLGHGVDAALPDSVADILAHGYDSLSVGSGDIQDVVDAIRGGYVPMEYRAGYRGETPQGEIRFSAEQIADIRRENPDFGYKLGFDCAQKDEYERIESNHTHSSENRPNRITFENTFADLVRTMPGESLDDAKARFEAKYDMNTATVIEKSDNALIDRSMMLRIDKAGRSESPIKMWEISIKERPADGMSIRDMPRVRAAYIGDIFGNVVSPLVGIGESNRLPLKESGHIQIVDRSSSDVDKFRFKAGPGGPVVRFSEAEKEALEKRVDQTKGKFADALLGKIEARAATASEDMSRYRVAARVFGDAADKYGTARNVVLGEACEKIKTLDANADAIRDDITKGSNEPISPEGKEFIGALSDFANAFRPVDGLECGYNVCQNGSVIYQNAADKLEMGLEQLGRATPEALKGLTGEERLQVAISVDSQLLNIADPAVVKLENVEKSIEAGPDIDRIISEKCDSINSENVEKYGDDAKYYGLTYDSDTGKVYTYSGYAVTGVHVGDGNVDYERSEYNRNFDQNIDEDGVSRKDDPDKANGSPISTSEEIEAGYRALLGGNIDIVERVGGGVFSVEDIARTFTNVGEERMEALLDRVQRDGPDFRDTISGEDLKKDVDVNPAVDRSGPTTDSATGENVDRDDDRWARVSQRERESIPESKLDELKERASNIAARDGRDRRDVFSELKYEYLASVRSENSLLNLSRYGRTNLEGKVELSDAKRSALEREAKAEAKQTGRDVAKVYKEKEAEALKELVGIKEKIVGSSYKMSEIADRVPFIYHRLHSGFQYNNLNRTFAIKDYMKAGGAIGKGEFLEKGVNFLECYAAANSFFNSNYFNTLLLDFVSTRFPSFEFKDKVDGLTGRVESALRGGKDTAAGPAKDVSRDGERDKPDVGRDDNRNDSVGNIFRDTVGGTGTGFADRLDQDRPSWDTIFRPAENRTDRPESAGVEAGENRDRDLEGGGRPNFDPAAAADGPGSIDADDKAKENGPDVSNDKEREVEPDKNDIEAGYDPFDTDGGKDSVGKDDDELDKAVDLENKDGDGEDKDLDRKEDDKDDTDKKGPEEKGDVDKKEDDEKERGVDRKEDGDDKSEGKEGRTDKEEDKEEDKEDGKEGQVESEPEDSPDVDGPDDKGDAPEEVSSPENPDMEQAAENSDAEITAPDVEAGADQDENILGPEDTEGTGADENNTDSADTSDTEDGDVDADDSEQAPLYKDETGTPEKTGRDEQDDYDREGAASFEELYQKVNESPSAGDTERKDADVEAATREYLDGNLSYDDYLNVISGGIDDTSLDSIVRDYVSSIAEGGDTAFYNSIDLGSAVLEVLKDTTIDNVYSDLTDRLVDSGVPVQDAERYVNALKSDISDHIENDSPDVYKIGDETFEVGGQDFAMTDPAIEDVTSYMEAAAVEFDTAFEAGIDRAVQDSVDVPDGNDIDIPSPEQFDAIGNGAMTAAEDFANGGVDAEAQDFTDAFMANTNYELENMPRNDVDFNATDDVAARDFEMSTDEADTGIDASDADNVDNFDGDNVDTPLMDDDSAEAALEVLL